MGQEQDMDALQQALAALEKGVFTSPQMEYLRKMMASWDDRGDVTENEQEDLMRLFENQFDIIGALTQLIAIAEKYAQDAGIDLKIKDMITASMDKWKVEGPKSSFGR